MNNQTKAIVKYYGQIPVEFVEHEGETWVTAEATGRALGYSEPGRAVRKILDRYPEDFEGLICRTKMVPQGDDQIREIIILSRDAVNLVGLFSKQPSAVQFRKFVLNVLREIQENGYYGEKKDLNFEALNSFRGLDGAEMLLSRAKNIIARESEAFYTRMNRLKKELKAAFKPIKRNANGKVSKTDILKVASEVLVDETQVYDRLYEVVIKALKDKPEAKSIEEFRNGAIFKKNGEICFHGGFYYKFARKRYKGISNSTFFKEVLRPHEAYPVELYIGKSKTRAWAIK